MYKKIIILFVLLICFGGLKAQFKLEEPVKWSYAAKRINAKQAIVYMKATMEKGWHINSIHQPDGGPLKTSFKFAPSKAYTLLGKTIEPKPKKKYEEVFGINVLYFEDSAVFSQKISLGSSAVVVKGKLEFMACTTDKCLPPAELDFSIPIK